MKKMFALMLALMLALAGMSAAFAEDAAGAPSIPVTPAVSSGAGTIDLKVNLNGDLISQLLGASGKEAAGKAAAIVELLNNMSITMTSDGVDAEMFIKVKDEPVAGMAVLKDTDKMFILSDLFPHYILKIDQNAMGAQTADGQSAAVGMPQLSIDPEQMNAMMAPATKLLNDMMAKVGQPEAVQETFYETEFTAKSPINLTTKEALQMVLGAAKDIVSQEGFAALLEQLKASGITVNFNAEEIDKKLEEINNAKDEDLPVLDASVYSNQAQDGLFVINVTKNEETVEVKTGSIKGGFVNEVTVPGKAHVFVQGSQTDGSVTMNIQFVPQKGLTIDIDGNFKASDAGFTGMFTVKMNGVVLGVVTISGSPEPTMSGAFGMEDKTEITIADLQDPSGKTAEAFKADLMAGLMTCLAKVVLAVPDLSEIMQQLMPMSSLPFGK